MAEQRVVRLRHVARGRVVLGAGDMREAKERRGDCRGSVDSENHDGYLEVEWRSEPDHGAHARHDRGVVARPGLITWRSAPSSNQGVSARS